MDKLDFLRVFDDMEMEEISRRLLLSKNGYKMYKLFIRAKPKKKWKKLYTYFLADKNDEEFFFCDDYVYVFDKFNELKGENNE